MKKKYGNKFVNILSIDDKITFYALAQDWKNYVKYINEKIKKVPPQINGKEFGALGDAWALNYYAWTLFQFCSNKKVLPGALSWVNLAIKLDTTSYNANYIDTKANLLYRIGKKKEAIELQEIAVTRSKSDKDIVETLRKMKADLPTWPEKQ